MLTNDQMHAVRATLDNVKHLNNEMTAYARNINDGAYSLSEVGLMFKDDFGKCLILANEINSCFSWANVSTYDIPQAVYNYLNERLEDLAA